MVKKTFQKKSDETGVDLYLSLTLYGFKSTYGAQFFFLAFMLQHFVASIAQTQLSSNIEYPTEYSDSVNLSWLTTENLFTGSVDKLHNFQMLFCYFIKRSTGNQSIIKTLCPRIKMMLMDSHFSFFFKSDVIAQWSCGICPHPVLARELLGGTHL